METGKIITLVGLYYILTRSYAGRGDIYPPQAGAGHVQY